LKFSHNFFYGCRGAISVTDRTDLLPGSGIWPGYAPSLSETKRGFGYPLLKISAKGRAGCPVGKGVKLMIDYFFGNRYRELLLIYAGVLTQLRELAEVTIERRIGCREI
jgi:hypothetical protein